MISLDEALERIFAFANPLAAEQCAIDAAFGRILAKPVKAKTSQPPFNASAMDGYAVRHKDIVAGVTLDMVGASQAGAGFNSKLGPGQCTRIFTGAPMPAGADSVVMQEKVTAQRNMVTFIEPVKLGQSVRKLGNDFVKGDTLLHPGDVLTPAAIALAASANNAKLSVHRLPEIALLATGDELVPPGSTLAPDQIVASNSVALSALFAPYCSTVQNMGIATDDEADLRSRLEIAFDSDADVVITTGGASVGDHDIVQPVLKSIGVEIDFWKIAMRPGKPLMFGKKGNTLVFGLPGNPVSAMITATTVVLPALRALAGSRAALGPRLRLPLAAPLAANGPRRHFIRGTIVAKDNGVSAVRPLTETDSAHLSSLAQANALIVHYEDAPEQPVGNIAEIIPLLPQ